MINVNINKEKQVVTDMIGQYTMMYYTGDATYIMRRNTFLIVIEQNGKAKSGIQILTTSRKTVNGQNPMMILREMY